jgi:CheY-like chemotaxis protein
LNGLEATREIRRIETDGGFAPTPIIGVSAYAMASDVENCLASGMDGFMAKPVSPNKLAEKIARHLKSADSDAA